jgi:WD40 repeat protein
MFNRCRSMGSRRLSGLVKAFFACGAIAFGGCITPPSQTTAVPQTQADRTAGPFEMVGAPFAADELKSSDDGRALIATEPQTERWEMKRVRVWDLYTARPLSGPLPFNWDYGLSADGKIAFTTDTEHIRVWDVATSRQLWTIELHHGQLDSVAISPDGTEIAAISEVDKSVKIWRIGSDKPRLSIKQTEASISVDFDPTGKRIATISGRVQIYDAQTGNQLVPELYAATDWDIRHLFDSTGRRFLELLDGVTRVIDTATGQALLRIESKEIVDEAGWSADSDKILVRESHHMVYHIYDAANGTLERTIGGDVNDVTRAWILHGGRWAIVERFRKPLEVVDLTTGQKVQTLGDSQYCACGPFGSTLVTEDSNRLKRIWKLRADFK